MKNLDIEKFVAFWVGVGITFLLVITFSCSPPNPILSEGYQDSLLAAHRADSAAFADSLNALDTATDLPIDSQMKMEEVFDSLAK